jgi:hypothetical protein
MSPEIYMFVKLPIDINDFVIVNDFDQPCVNLVAQVNKIDGATGYVTYISEAIKYKPNFKIDLNEATNVKDFGVEIRISRITTQDGSKFSQRKEARAVKCGESRAVYRDGKARRWQPTQTERNGYMTPIKWEIKGS